MRAPACYNSPPLMSMPTNRPDPPRPSAAASRSQPRPQPSSRMAGPDCMLQGSASSVTSALYAASVNSYRGAWLFQIYLACSGLAAMKLVWPGPCSRSMMLCARVADGSYILCGRGTAPEADMASFGEDSATDRVSSIEGGNESVMMADHDLCSAQSEDGSENGRCEAMGCEVVDVRWWV